MANNIWESGSTKVAQVHTLEVDSQTDGDVWVVLLEDYLGNSDSVTFTSTAAATTAEIMNSLGAQIVAATATGNAPWSGITATEDDTTLTLTGTAGQPFTVTPTVTGTGTWDVDTDTTECSGPNLYNDPQNWSLQAIPVNTNDVIIPYYASNDIYGYDASGIEHASFTVEDGCPIAIGSPLKYLSIEVSTTGTFTLGGLGLSYINSTCSDNDGVMSVRNAGTGGGDYGSSLNLDGDGIHTVTIDAPGNAKIGLGVLGSSSMSIVAQVIIRNGIVELGTITSSPNLTIYAGRVTLKSALTTVTVHGGILYHNKGSITTMSVRTNGTVDASRDQTAKTITNTSVFRGSTLNDPLGVYTFTNGIDYQYCDLGDAEVKHGPHRTWTPSAI